MYTAEEKQYLSLHAKLNAELTEIEWNIKQLEQRYVELKAILNGTAEIEPESTPEPAINRRKEKTENNNDERAKLDDALVKLLGANEGLSRKEVNEALLKKGWSPWDVDKSLKRCKAKDLIVREGATVNAKWYAAETA